MEEDEVCPVCRSSTYLNPQMRFLVNPECYHKICESCVDRIFGRGPAACPYRGCGKTLRRQRFKTQLFEDLSVEREVDVRQRITRIFNAPETQFDTPREYDDYLEQMETLIFTLSAPNPNKLPEIEEQRALAEQEVSTYETEHRQEILDNALQQRQRRLVEEELARQTAERERRLRLLAVELQTQEREHRRISQEETVAALAAGRDAGESLKEAAARVKQRTDQLRQQYELELSRSRLVAAQQAQQAAQAVLGRNDTPSTPFTPFNGDREALLFTQQAQYVDPLLAAIGKDPSLLAGGFSLKFAEFGVLQSAFMGLEVDIQKEKAMSSA